MRRFRLTPIAVGLALMVAGIVLVRVVAFAEPPVDVGFSHQGLSPVPDCQLATPEGRPSEASPAAGVPSSLATPVAAATPGVLPDLNLRIEAVAGNGESADRGLPYPLRLFTLRLAPGETTDSLDAECELGFNLLYVASGDIEFTHPAGPSGSDTGQVGAVSYVRSGEPSETRLAAGAPVTLGAGDTIFLEEALFAFRNVGTGEAVLVGSAVTPEWLPCAGGGCN